MSALAANEAGGPPEAALPGEAKGGLASEPVQDPRELGPWNFSVPRRDELAVTIPVHGSCSVCVRIAPGDSPTPFHVFYTVRLRQAHGLPRVHSGPFQAALAKDPSTPTRHLGDADGDGTVAAEVPGAGYVVIIFDNTSAWFYSMPVKDLRCTVTGDGEAPDYEIGAREPETLSFEEICCTSLVRAWVEDAEIGDAVMPGDVALRHEFATMLRFSRARDCNPVKAFAMLREHVQWRADTLPIELTPQIQEEIAKRRMFRFGRSDTGHQVFVNVFRRFLDGYDADVVLRAQLHHIEAMAALDAERERAERGRNPQTYTTIIDCLGIRSPPLPYLKRLTAVFESNYPERSHRTIMYPIPGWVRTMIQGMMYFVDPVTRAKFAFCTTLEQCAEGAELALNALPQCVASPDAEAAALAAQIDGMSEEERQAALAVSTTSGDVEEDADEDDDEGGATLTL